MPRQKKINPEPLAEPVVEPVTEVPPPFIEEPIQALKKTPKVKKEKKPKAVKSSKPHGCPKKTSMQRFFAL